MNWVKKRKLLAMEVIKFNRQLCIELDDPWQALYQISNAAQKWPINFSLLNNIFSYLQSEWPPFSKAKITDTIKKYNNPSIPEPDHIL